MFDLLVKLTSLNKRSSVYNKKAEMPINFSLENFNRQSESLSFKEGILLLVLSSLLFSL